MCVAQSEADPLAGLAVGEHPDPDPPDGWVRVHVRAAALNHHDLWSLRGVGLRADRLPMVLGCDAAGVTDSGDEVIVHSVISHSDWRADETLDPRRTLLSEVHAGTMAEQVMVPSRNRVPKPPGLSFEQAACLPTAWLTAYRMLFTQAAVQPGERVLVQGAGGGLSTAAIALARAVGCTVWVTSRHDHKLTRAVESGAHDGFLTGTRLPSLVDVVIDSVGEATWDHSVRSLRPGGRLVVAGGTTGRAPATDLFRVTLLQLRILGSTMGTRSELEQLAAFCSSTGVAPEIDRVLPLERAAEGFAAMRDGDVFGKIVLVPGAGRCRDRS